MRCPLKLTNFFAPRDNSSIRAECYFTSFLVEHNLLLSAADHAGALFKKMFPDSKWQKNMVPEEQKPQTL